jgi:hypothetical protein
MYYEDYFTQIYQKIPKYKSYFGYYLQFKKIR